MSNEVAKQEHTKPRYSEAKTAKILSSTPKTLREWLREGGIPLPGGTRIPIVFVVLGMRKIEFEVDEVERVYRLLKRSRLADDDEFDEAESNDVAQRFARRAA
ncbi:MAG: hypothetical protein ACTHQM_15590 [Thermoanaerobaculia bacterium]